MGILEKFKGEKQSPAAQATGSTPVLDGRDRLRHFATQLAKANDAVVEMREREACVTEYLKIRTDALARTYLKAFRLLVRTHDQLTGVSIALSAGQQGSDIAMKASARIEVPRFNLPTLADPRGEYLATMFLARDDALVADTEPR